MRLLHDAAQCPPTMQLSEPDFEVLNPPPDFEQPEDVLECFALTAFHNTRLCRKSLVEDDFTAPMVLRRLRHPFVLCEVTVSIDFEMDWDQGGLVIFAGGHPAYGRTLESPDRPLRGHYVIVDPPLFRGPDKWARVALEMMAGELNVSTLVANHRCGVDWASTPAMLNHRAGHAAGTSTVSVRLKLERVGRDLWVWFMIYELISDNLTTPTPEIVSRQWRKCREIVSFFNDESIKGGIWVGCYASRPVQAETNYSGFHEDGLFAEFEDLTIL